MASNISSIPNILITSIGLNYNWDCSSILEPCTIYGNALQLTERSQGGNNNILGSTNYTNYLYGNASFLSNSRGGNDTITGGNKTDYIYGDAYKLEPDSDGNSDYLVGGDDILSGEGGNDFIYGDGYSLKNAIGGIDTLDGGLGRDILYGDGYYLINSRGGDDGLTDGSYGTTDKSTNYLYGDGYFLSQSSGGADTLTVADSKGNNYLYGDGYQLTNSVGGNDTLSGGDGNDILYGDGLTLSNSDPGDDVLWGGKGNDTLYGDARSITYASGSTFGADIFMFCQGDGKDIIMDFQQGIDKLDLTDWGVSTLSQLNDLLTLNNGTITRTSYQTKIDFFGNYSDVLTLNGKFDLISIGNNLYSP
jgi:Ca2+-binding RTX toxin-like protein